MLRPKRGFCRISDGNHYIDDIVLADTRSQNPHGDPKANVLTGRQDLANTSFIVSTDEDNPPENDEAVPNQPPQFNKKVLRPVFGIGTILLLILAFYSMLMSGLWFVVAILQPRWGFFISTSRGLSPSTATTLTALISKTTELVSAAVFVTCLGQVLTRRAVARNTTGITLAELTIRNWIIQPGSIFTHFGTILIAGRTFLGLLSLVALVATMLYTTASEALVSPKLKYGAWEARELTVPVHSHYGNIIYAGKRCMRDLGLSLNPKADVTKDVGSLIYCLYNQLGYISQRDFFTYLTPFAITSELVLERPLGTTRLHDDIKIEATWTDSEYSQPEKLFQRWGRIVDNITLSIPHPSVWEASQFASNGILQPEDLSNVGGYAIQASVVSPTITTICANMDKDELASLVYDAFPHSDKQNFTVWYDRETPTWGNSTGVDEIFQWGTNYGRWRPVFRSYPQNGSAILHYFASEDLELLYDAGYVLTKATNTSDYTLCEMRSWLSTDCSTYLDVSGIRQPVMRTRCGDNQDNYRYRQRPLQTPADKIGPKYWTVILRYWMVAVALEQPFDPDAISGSALPLGFMALRKPERLPDVPTIAEVISVYALSTLTLSALDTPVRHSWDHGNTTAESSDEEYLYEFNVTETFPAAIRSQEYTSGHTEDWQRLFYTVLGLTFLMNLLCLGYLLIHYQLVNDFTEPQNLFSLSINSPFCLRMVGSCLDGPEKEHLEVPWRISRSLDKGEYYFEAVGK